ncbi:serine hydrolase [Nocardioides sp. STR2]|uniref:Serine hydrolase n=1 Tax=Nocardioides pini TaxID=2975053 RepID=A0ABT4CBT4_9ACTN|nr:serine hydrolase domain-containing protein [Nocardioides pini]MCY4726426.1 serine hydrolase [Nocardioides pini]
MAHVLGAAMTLDGVAGTATQGRAGRRLGPALIVGWFGDGLAVVVARASCGDAWSVVTLDATTGSRPAAEAKDPQAHRQRRPNAGRLRAGRLTALGLGARCPDVGASGGALGSTVLSRPVEGVQTSVAVPTGRSHTSDMRALWALVVTAGVLAAGCSSDEPGATPHTPETDGGFLSAVATLEQRVDAYEELTTGVIALVRAGGQVQVLTDGEARLRPRIAMQADMRFPLASITKSMTATVVMQLVEGGRLALDDPIDQWVPELGSVAQPITVGQLLSHRSGLPHATDAELRRWGSDSSRLLRAIGEHPLEFRPGTSGSYSNEGYVALGLAAERILDASYGDVLQTRVFDPAGMTSANLFGPWDVRGYDDGTDVSEQFFLKWIPPAGSVVATAADVDAFYQALWSGNLVGPEALRQMRTTRGNVGEFSDYGLGLARERFSCGPAMGHSGRLKGISTEAWSLDGNDRSTVVLVNDQLSDVARILVDAALCS